jgi:hypothetical protein
MYSIALLATDDPPHWGQKAMSLYYSWSGRVERRLCDEDSDVEGAGGGIGCTPMDLEAGNSKSLSLWYMGEVGNAELPMYVELGSQGRKKKVFHDDPYAASNPDWSEWNIALSEFESLDLSKTETMAVGLTADGPLIGGFLNYDDIRLYPSRCIAEYGPAADFTGDCFVGYDDLRLMLNEWLLSEEENGIWNGTWSNSDIGDCDPAGSFSDNGDGTYTMTADGADIWGNADAFHYAYQQMSGDGQMIVRVTSLEWTNGWAKAGVMMRQDLDPNSAHAFMAATTDNGVSFQRRPAKGGGSEDSTHGGRNVPMCVRLVRVGDTFTGYFFEDGIWKEAGTRVIPMTDPIYVGMAATSHVYGTATTAEFDRECISSMVDLNEDGTTNFVDYAALMEQWLVEILWP